jgi:hypothetical protein
VNAEIGTVCRRNAYHVWVVKPHGEETIWETICWWVSNVIMDLGEIGFEDVNLWQIDSEKGIRLDFVNTIMINCCRQACTVKPINNLGCRRL